MELFRLPLIQPMHLFWPYTYLQVDYQFRFHIVTIKGNLKYQPQTNVLRRQIIPLSKKSARGILLDRS